jgi:hypothetical protein
MQNAECGIEKQKIRGLENERFSSYNGAAFSSL